MQIDYLLLAIALFPFIAGSLLAYVARKNKGGTAHLPNINDDICYSQHQRGSYGYGNDEEVFNGNL